MTKAWIAQLKKSGATPELLATLRDGKQADIAERIKALQKYATEPAVGDAILEIVTAPPWTSDGSKPLWKLVFELASMTNDPRLKAATPKWDVRPLIKTWLSNGWKKAVAELPEMTDGKREQLAVAKKHVSTRNTSEADLLAAIYENPADDTPRQIYADYLQEKGDPRGEFISLQLSNADAKRQKSLMKAHGKQWLGELAEVIANGFEFRRGFLSKATIKFRNKSDFDAWGSRPEWATLEEVDFAGRTTTPQGQAEFVYAITPAMKGLKKASGVWRTDIVNATEPWALEELEVCFPERELVALLESDKFPRLHTVRLALPQQVNAPLFERVTRTSVKHFHGVSEMPAEAATAASRLPFESVTLNNLEYRRGPNGALHHSDAPKARAPDADIPAAGVPLRFVALPDDTLFLATIGHLLHVAADGKRVLRQTPIKFFPYTCSTFDRRAGRFIAVHFQRVRVFDPVSGATLVDVSTPFQPTLGGLLTMSDDGRFCSGESGFIFDLTQQSQVDAPRGAAKATFIEAGLHWWLQWEKQPGGGNVLTVASADSTQSLRLEGAGGSQHRFAVSPSGALFVSTREPRSVDDARTRERLSVFDVNTGARTASLTDVSLSEFCCAGALVAAKTHDGAAVLDAKSLEVVAEWKGAERVAVSDDRKTAWVLRWDVPGGRMSITREAFDR